MTTSAARTAPWAPWRWPWRWRLAGAALAPVASFAQDGDAVVVNATTGDLGTYLVDAEGNTLYYFTRDVTPGVSVCSGGCLEAWPPLAVAEGQSAPGR